MPAQNKTSLGLNQWLGNEYPKRVDFVEDNRIINDELEKRVKNTDLAKDTEAGILTLNKVREVAPKPDLSPYVTYSKGFRNTNNTDSFIRTDGVTTWASNLIEMWGAGTRQGSLYTNGTRAYYAVPGRNDGNFNEIMDNHDMAARDNNIQHAHNRITDTWNRASDAWNRTQDLYNLRERDTWKQAFVGEFGTNSGVICYLPSEWSEIIIYYSDRKSTRLNSSH